MSAFYIGCLFGTVILASASQMIIKKVVSGNVRSLEGSLNLWDFFSGLLRSPLIYAAAALTIFAAGLWLIALSKVPINVALPFMFLNYAAVALLSYFIFGETLSHLQIVGVAFMMIGLWLIMSFSRDIS